MTERITIIKRGTPPSEQVFTATCHHCKSELEAKAGGLQVQHGTPRDPGPYAPDLCPVCNNTVTFYPKQK